MKGREWLTIEEERLRLNAPIKTMKELIILFPERTRRSIQWKIERLGIDRKKFVKLSRNDLWTENDYKILRRFGGIYNKKQLMELFKNRTWEGIQNKINELKIDRRKFKGECTQFLIPQPSKDFSWWLGALAGDGTISGNNVRLQVIDADFAKEFESIGRDIYNITPRFYFRHRQHRQNARGIYDACFCSKGMSQYLGDWSELNWPMTLKNKFGWILKEEQYISAFLSGYTDAEGYIEYHKKHSLRVNIAAQPKHIKKMLHQLCDTIKIKNVISQNGIRIGGINNLKRFAQLIRLSIKRKQDKLDLIKSIKIKHEDGYKKAQKLKKEGQKYKEISVTLGIPYQTVYSWFYKGYKPKKLEYPD